MAPKVFLTGATGYIGGTAHAFIAKAHPDWEFTLLVRDEERGRPIKDKYPDTKFVYGGLDDNDVVQKVAAEADIVVHTADSADNDNGARNIAKGLADGHSADKPGYWIHVSGTGILTWYDAKAQRLGESPLPEQKYHDIEGVERLVNEIPDEASHRKTDKIVQAAISDAVKVAIIAPPTIYGTGSGVVNRRSIQVPDFTKGSLEKGFVPIVEAGKTEWDHVHIDDLGDLFLRLADATQDPSKASNPEIFGPHAYFFAENGHHVWSEVSKWIAESASRLGYLPEALTKVTSKREVDLMGGRASTSFYRNSKGVAARARKYLGWEAKGEPLKDTIDEVVELEAKALGFTPKEKKG